MRHKGMNSLGENYKAHDGGGRSRWALASHAAYGRTSQSIGQMSVLTAANTIARKSSQPPSREATSRPTEEATDARCQLCAASGSVACLFSSRSSDMEMMGSKTRQSTKAVVKAVPEDTRADPRRTVAVVTVNTSMQTASHARLESISTGISRLIENPGYWCHSEEIRLFRGQLHLGSCSAVEEPRRNF